MDNGEIPVETIVVSVTSSPGNVDGIERQGPVIPTPIRKKLARVSTLVVKILRRIVQTILWGIWLGFWSPFIVCFYSALTWKRVFLLSCIAVSIDSLFLYIPIIDQEHKCLDMDKRVRNVALVLRSLTDAAFMFHILLLTNDEIDVGRPKWDDSDSDTDHSSATSWLRRKLKLVRVAIAEKMPWLSISIILNFLAILPIPQVAIVVGFFSLGGSKHFLKQTIINVFLVFQYSLRVSQIFLSIKNVGETVGKWVKASFFFLMYIIAGHVLAAFWYFFSIQREISCWDQACRTISGCMHVYDCSRRLSINNTLLNKLCPIDTPNATLFDFGIFHDILQSGNTGSTNFSTKILYSFWWGLRNISNFGTNLETSSYMWENCFAVLICVIGLLLFLLLIGNVQTYIQSETQKSVTIEESRRTSIYTKYRDIEKWMSSHGVPDDMKIRIRKYIKEDKLVKVIDKDVDSEFIHKFYAHWVMRSNPLNFVCVNALKKIPILQDVEEQNLKMFCFRDHVPDYTTKEKNSYITRAGQRLDTMYLIIDGKIERKDAETTGSSPMSSLTAGRRYDYVGEEVLRWAMLNYRRSYLERDPYPLSTVDVKCQTKIGAFKFTADQLIKIFEKIENPEQLEALALTQGSKTEHRIQDWLLRNGFPEDMKANIKKCLDKNSLLWEENRNADVDVDFLFGILPENIKPSIKHHLGMNALKQVPMLQKMHEYVLEIICNHLEPAVYKKNSYIVRAGEPLSIMIFILRGTIIFTDTSSDNTTTSSSEITEACDENALEIDSYYGEKLLRWASPNNISSFENPVISSRDVKCKTNVEALILKADDLRSAVSKCGSQWNINDRMNSQHLVGYGRERVGDSDTGSFPSTFPINEQTIQLHQGHDMLLEQLILIRETVFQLRNDMSTQGWRIDEMAAFLAKLGYTSASSPPPAP